MNLLLLFFALPVATIILAVVLEKILRCPILTAATFFAIYLVLAFAVFGNDFLILVIIYTILAFIAAILAEIFFRRCKEERNIWRCCSCHQRETKVNTTTLSNQDIRRIAEQLANLQNNSNAENQSCSDNDNTENNVATVKVNNETTGGRTTWCCYRR